MDFGISPVEKVPNLYISGSFPASKKPNLISRSIKAVVSCGLQFKPIFDDVEYMLIPVDDDEEEMIITYFPKAIEFIKRNLATHGVLVHCAAGISRSASVVIAYLMSEFQMDANEGLESLRITRPIVGPNLGFRHQLSIFHEMGYKLDKSHPEFKRMYLMVSAQAKESSLDSFRERRLLEQLASIGIGEVKLPSGDEKQAKPSTVFRCRMCRNVLATEENAVSHEPKAEASMYEARHRAMLGPVLGAVHHSSVKPKDTAPCTSVFLEPMTWIHGVERGEMEGVISCPKCSAKIGHFTWVGASCSCGTWVAPAFALHKSKVDIMTQTQTQTQTQARTPTQAQAQAQDPST